MLGQLFDEIEEESVALGEPTRPAEDTISLDAVFGDAGGEPGGSAAPDRAGADASAGGGSGGAAAEAAAGAAAGFSFDEFFNAPGGAARGGAGDEAALDSAPRSSGPQERPAADDEGDLDQFQDWLKKLKS